MGGGFVDGGLVGPTDIPVEVGRAADGAGIVELGSFASAVRD